MKLISAFFLLMLSFTVPAMATVVVSNPSNGETTGTTVNYAATATTTTCSKGVASMGVYVDNKLDYVAQGTTLSTSLAVSAGTHNTVVEEWDYCGGATYNSMTITANNSAGVVVTSPAAGATVSSPASYVATATSSCAKGIASMGIYVNNVLVYVVAGAKLNTQLALSSGSQHTVVEEWDYCGGATYQTINVTVAAVGSTLSNLQTKTNWNVWGEFAPLYDICTANCAGIGWTRSTGISSPSMSGNATKHTISGSTPYADVLWSLPVLGQESTLGYPDTAHTLLPTLHNFTYDAYFYVTNPAVTQVLEFDVSMYMNGAGMIWGQQCNNLGGKEWDIWDNVSSAWVSAGVPCNLLTGWNHVTITMQRESGNVLLYQTIALNGTTYTLNKTYQPFSVPSSWWGVTVNYQMDGDSKMDANTTYLDNFNLTYY